MSMTGFLVLVAFFLGISLGLFIGWCQWGLRLKFYRQEALRIPDWPKEPE